MITLANLFYKWAIPGLFLVYFRSFQTNINAIFITDQCEKMSGPSSIWRRDLNPQPLEREPPPITTRPGLPPILYTLYDFNLCPKSLTKSKFEVILTKELCITIVKHLQD